MTANDLWYNCDLMITVKRHWLLGGLILTWLLLAFPAGAQTEVDRLNRVQVDLWPDYDRAAVLVLTTIELPAELALPAVVALKLPAAVSQPSAVAYITAAGEMFDTAYQTELNGETNLLRVNTVEPIVRIEYYYPYERADNSVQFTYQWLGGTSVDDLIILVQEPAQASSFAAEPSLEDVGILSDGRHYYQWQVGALGKDETRQVTVSYVAPAFTSSSALPPSPSAASDDGDLVILPILTALGGLAIGTGIGWYLSNRRVPVQRSLPQRRKAIHCRQCGSRLQVGDSFCRRCGTKIR